MENTQNLQPDVSQPTSKTPSQKPPLKSKLSLWIISMSLFLFILILSGVFFVGQGIKDSTPTPSPATEDFLEKAVE